MSDRDHISGGRGVDESRQFSSFFVFSRCYQYLNNLLGEQYGPSRTLGQNSCFMQVQNMNFYSVKPCYFREHIFLSLSRLALRAINFLGSRRQRMCTPGMRVAARVVLNMLSVRATFRMNIYFDQAVAYIEKSAYLTEVTSGLKCAISLKI